MKTPILVGFCAAMSLGAAMASAGQQGKSPKPSADDDAPDTIACAQESGEPLGRCTYGVKRGEAGRTTVTVAFANGFERRLFFEDGMFLKANATMSGTGTDTDWSIEDGMHRVRVDDQRYDVPDTLLAGTWTPAPLP